MIREATKLDIPQMVKMGERFRESAYSKHLESSPETMARLGEWLIERNSLLVSEEKGKITGMLGFTIFPHFISGEITIGEVFWFVDPEIRGSGIKLMKEMERRGRVAGARKMQMVAPNDKVAHFYERIGFDYMEETWQKAL